MGPVEQDQYGDDEVKTMEHYSSIGECKGFTLRVRESARGHVCQREPTLYQHYYDKLCEPYTYFGY